MKSLKMWRTTRESYNRKYKVLWNLSYYQRPRYKIQNYKWKSFNLRNIKQVNDVATYQELIYVKYGDHIINISMEMKEVLDGKQFS